ncbi:MAG: cytochrome c [Campylobacterota bacterium]|nr:cytochrome c [Campylobacterota bacterium]
MKKLYLIVLFASSTLLADKLDGKKLFETYCWGCHHQTAVAFGPPFTEIADKRSRDEIKAYIIEPKAMYKQFGYKRTVMTQLKLNDNEIDALSDYILKYKGKK